MANLHKQPTIEHVPARRARGLDDEVTAQPRSIADELDLEAASEPELSVDPEDLGARFLSDAIEQGDFSPAHRFAADSSLNDVPARDQPLSGPNFIAGNSVWEQTVELETRKQAASEHQLREPEPMPEASADADSESGPRTTGMRPMPEASADADSESEPRTTGMRPKAPLKAAAQSLLGRGAGLLRRVAERLERYGT